MFFVATLFRFVARFARVRIEDSGFNRFALNGIQRDFFGGIFSGGIFVGGILSGYPTNHIAMYMSNLINILFDSIFNWKTIENGSVFPLDTR